MRLWAFLSWLVRAIRTVWNLNGNGTSDPKTALALAIKTLVYNKMIIWIGETTFACIPLLTYFLVKKYGIQERYEGWCNATFSACQPASKFPISEFDVISVVIAGLGILSLFESNVLSVRISRSNGWVYIAGLIQLILLIIGSILYSLEVSGGGRNNVNASIMVFTFSLFLSGSLTFMNAWQEALTAHRPGPNSSPEHE